MRQTIVALLVLLAVSLPLHAQSNGWTLDNSQTPTSTTSTLRVGVGTSAPITKFQVFSGQVNAFSLPGTLLFNAAQSTSLSSVTPALGLGTPASSSSAGARVRLGFYHPQSTGNSANVLGAGIDFIANATAGTYGETGDLTFNFNTGNGGALELAERVRLTSGGSIGIGTAAPLARLQLNTAQPNITTTPAALFSITSQSSDISTTPPALGLGTQPTSGTGAGARVRLGYYHPQSTANSSNVLAASVDFVANAVAGNYGETGDLTFNLNNGNTNSVVLAERMRITSGGIVVIGQPAPDTTVRLNVEGNAKFSGSVTASQVFNAVFGQDVAEWVRGEGELPAGTVVILNPMKRDEVMPSTTAYDSAVAGVVSAQPAVILGRPGERKVTVATSGRVRVRVDARKGSIHVGDLLVTSDEPGAAMKSQPIDVGGRKFHQPGTILGKALEPLEGGRGEILVLLCLG